MISREYYSKIIQDLDFMSFDELLIKYNIMASELLGIIDCSIDQFDSKAKRKKLRKILHQYQYIKNFPQKKYLLLSDTHFGSPLQNCSYVKMAYEFGREQQAEVAFHLGDFFDGCSGKTHKVRPKKKEKIVKDCYEQLNCLELYPDIIPTFVLLGNHDLSFQDVGICLEEELQKRNQTIEILGYGGVYVKCSYRKIYLSHFCKRKIYLKDKYDYHLSLQGHSHSFQYFDKKRLFTLASISDLQENKNGTGSLIPGFAIMTMHHRSITILGYTFSNNGPEQCLKLKL